MDSTLLTILLLVAIAFVLVVRQQVATRLQTTKSKVVHDANASKGGPNTIYHRLRSIALTTTAAQLGLMPRPEKPWVFGLVMDFDLGEGMTSLTAFENGDASLLQSGSSGMLGEKGNEKTTIAVDQLIRKAQSAVINAHPSQESPLPERVDVNFFFLTDQGVFFHVEKLIEIQENRSPWVPLFRAANSLKLILEKEYAEQRAAME